MCYHSDIAVIFERDKNPKTGEMETIVSHGVDINTLEIIVLPTELKSLFMNNCEWCIIQKEYFLK